MLRFRKWLRIFNKYRNGAIKMPEFYQTIMGRKFYERDVVECVQSIKRIAQELERSNELKEQELQMKLRELSIKEQELFILSAKN